MDKIGTVPGMVSRASLVLSLFILGGCTLFTPGVQDPVVVAEPVPEPAPRIPLEVTPEPAPPPPAPVPEPEPIPPPEPVNIAPLVAVVISDRTRAYVGVAEALDAYLENHEVYDLNDRSLASKDAFASISDSKASAVVAIGLPAALAARKYSTVPVVVGQVFNINDSDLLSAEVKAVGVLPPIEKQLDAWRKLDPSLRNVGAILGPGHDALVEETDQAMKDRGVKFHYAIAQSDRETLYLFNRLVRDIDGFVLFPDNRILSRTVLGEMMTYASRHRVQIAVYNEPLLEFGAAFSAASVDSDIAETIADVLDEIINGDIESVPPVTGLSEIKIQTNEEVLEKLGLTQSDADIENTMAGTK